MTELIHSGNQDNPNNQDNQRSIYDFLVEAGVGVPEGFWWSMKQWINAQHNLRDFFSPQIEYDPSVLLKLKDYLGSDILTAMRKDARLPNEEAWNQLSNCTNLVFQTHIGCQLACSYCRPGVEVISGKTKDAFVIPPPEMIRILLELYERMAGYSESFYSSDLCNLSYSRPDEFVRPRMKIMNFGGIFTEPLRWSGFPEMLMTIITNLQPYNEEHLPLTHVSIITNLINFPINEAEGKSFLWKRLGVTDTTFPLWLSIICSLDQMHLQAYARLLQQQNSSLSYVEALEQSKVMQTARFSNLCLILKRQREMGMHPILVNTTYDKDETSPEEAIAITRQTFEVPHDVKVAALERQFYTALQRLASGVGSPNTSRKTPSGQPGIWGFIGANSKGIPYFTPVLSGLDPQNHDEERFPLFILP